MNWKHLERTRRQIIKNGWLRHQLRLNVRRFSCALVIDLEWSCRSVCYYSINWKYFLTSCFLFSPYYPAVDINHCCRFPWFGFLSVVSWLCVDNAIPSLFLVCFFIPNCLLLLLVFCVVFFVFGKVYPFISAIERVGETKARKALFTTKNTTDLLNIGLKWQRWLMY